MLKYYWDQIFFYDYKQGSNDQKTPRLLTNTKEAFDYYKEKTKL